MSRQVEIGPTKTLVQLPYLPTWEHPLRDTRHRVPLNAGDVAVLTDEEFALIPSSVFATGTLIDRGEVEDPNGVKVTIGAGKSNVVLPNGATLDAGESAVLTPEEFSLIPVSWFPATIVNSDDKLVFADIPIKLKELNRVQTVKVSANAGQTLTGNFTITYGAQTTGNLNVATVTAAQVQTALEALSTLAPGDIVVEQTADDANLKQFKITFDDVVLTSFGAVTASDVSLVGAGKAISVVLENYKTILPGFDGKVVAADWITTVAAAGGGGSVALNLRRDPALPGFVTGGVATPTTVGATAAGVIMAGTAVTANTNAVKTITSDADGGTWKISINSANIGGGSHQTDALTAIISNADLKAALEALPNIGPGNVDVGGGQGAWTITFEGDLGALDVGNPIFIDKSLASKAPGGADSATITTGNSVTGARSTFSDQEEIAVLPSAITPFTAGEGILRLTLLKS